MYDEKNSGNWPIFVLSLHDAKERQDKIFSRLQQLGLEFEVIDAVDGRNGLTAENEALIDRKKTIQNLSREMSDAEYACALSHLSIYQRIQDNDLPGAVILEDDAVLDDLFLEFIEHQGYKSFDFIQLLYRNVRVFRFLKQQQPTPNIRCRALGKSAECAVAYSISKAGADYILEHSFPLSSVADWTCDIMPLKPHISIPKLASHPEEKADHSYLREPRNQMLHAAYDGRWSRKYKKRLSMFLTKKYWLRKFQKTVLMSIVK